MDGLGWTAACVTLPALSCLPGLLTDHIYISPTPAFPGDTSALPLHVLYLPCPSFPSPLPYFFSPLPTYLFRSLCMPISHLQTSNKHHWADMAFSLDNNKDEHSTSPLPTTIPKTVPSITFLQKQSWDSSLLQGQGQLCCSVQEPLQQLCNLLSFHVIIHVQHLSLPLSCLLSLKSPGLLSLLPGCACFLHLSLPLCNPSPPDYSNPTTSYTPTFLPYSPICYSLVVCLLHSSISMMMTVGWMGADR